MFTRVKMMEPSSVQFCVFSNVKFTKKTPRRKRSFLKHGDNDMKMYGHIVILCSYNSPEDPRIT